MSNHIRKRAIILRPGVGKKNRDKNLRNGNNPGKRKSAREIERERERKEPVARTPRSFFPPLWFQWCLVAAASALPLPSPSSPTTTTRRQVKHFLSQSWLLCRYYGVRSVRALAVDARRLHTDSSMTPGQERGKGGRDGGAFAPNVAALAASLQPPPFPPTSYLTGGECDRCKAGMRWCRCTTALSVGWRYHVRWLRLYSVPGTLVYIVPSTPYTTLHVRCGSYSVQCVLVAFLLASW